MMHRPRMIQRLAASSRHPGAQPRHTLTGRLVAIECTERNGLHMHRLRIRHEDADGDATVLASDTVCHFAFGRQDGERAAAFASRVHMLMNRRVRVVGRQAPVALATDTHMIACHSCELVGEAAGSRRAA